MGFSWGLPQACSCAARLSSVGRDARLLSNKPTATLLLPTTARRSCACARLPQYGMYVSRSSNRPGGVVFSHSLRLLGRVLLFFLILLKSTLFFPDKFPCFKIRLLFGACPFFFLLDLSRQTSSHRHADLPLRTSNNGIGRSLQKQPPGSQKLISSDQSSQGPRKCVGSVENTRNLRPSQRFQLFYFPVKHVRKPRPLKLG